MMKKQQGFTLIELIVVIVILGILAATALPKFISLSSDARIAVLKSLEGAGKSVAMMAHGKALVAGSSVTTTGVAGNIDGQAVTLDYGYPTAPGIDLLLQDRGGATFATPVWTLQSSCSVQYNVPTSVASGVPSFTYVTSGC